MYTTQPPPHRQWVDTHASHSRSSSSSTPAASPPAPRSPPWLKYMSTICSAEVPAVE